MPHHFPVAEDADRLAFLLHVRDHRHFGRQVEELVAGALLEVALVQAGRGHRHAEALDEPDEVFRGERLPAEHQHHVVEPGAVQVPEGRVVERFQVEAAHFRAERGRRRHDLEPGALRAAICHRGCCHDGSSPYSAPDGEIVAPTTARRPSALPVMQNFLPVIVRGPITIAAGRFS
ncbi:hypothetical protein D3C83_02460 [compost metagenome]